jgi:polyphosphate kinase
MTRNLERRVELMFPVISDDLRRTIIKGLSSYFNDNTQAWLLDSSGAWARLEPESGEKPFRIQAYFHSMASKAHETEPPGSANGEFIVRRSPPSKG